MLLSISFEGENRDDLGLSVKDEAPIGPDTLDKQGNKDIPHLIKDGLYAENDVNQHYNETNEDIDIVITLEYEDERSALLPLKL